MPLSRRQHEVLAAIAQNFSNKEIAAKLNVSVRTVKFHVSTLLEKFEVRGRVDLMIEAAEFLPIEGVHKRVAAQSGIGLGCGGCGVAASWAYRCSCAACDCRSRSVGALATDCWLARGTQMQRLRNRTRKRATHRCKSEH